MTGWIRTVTGDIPAQSLGVTLIHEHLYMDATVLFGATSVASHASSQAFGIEEAAKCRWNPGSSLQNYEFMDEDLVVADLNRAVDSGIGAVVDVTPIDMGRSHEALVRISHRTGIPIVMGTGYYLSSAHGRHLPSGSEESATYERIMREHETGIDGVKPGIIGEIGTSDPIASSEMSVLRGAAKAARDSGLGLSIHVHPWGWTGREILEVLDPFGLDLRRVVLGHMNTAISDRPYLHSLLDSGAVLGFDLFGFDHALLAVGRYPPTDWSVAETVAELVAEGFTDQLVLSQDVGVRTRLTAYGGWGYGHLLEHVVPMLEGMGVGETSSRQMLVGNCRRILSIGG